MDIGRGGGTISTLGRSIFRCPCCSLELGDLLSKNFENSQNINFILLVGPLSILHEFLKILLHYICSGQGGWNLSLDGVPAKY